MQPYETEDVRQKLESLSARRIAVQPYKTEKGIFDGKMDGLSATLSPSGRRLLGSRGR